MMQNSKGLYKESTSGVNALIFYNYKKKVEIELVHCTLHFGRNPPDNVCSTKKLTNMR